MGFRSFLRDAAYTSGALAAYHRCRNNNTLTVVMFHRVLPAAEIERSEADPDYTLSTKIFASTIDFLRSHYTFVSLEEVLAARTGTARLPDRALLVTFDDGWRDNLVHAAPILHRYGVRSVMFVASNGLDEQAICWWQDVLLWALRSERCGFDELWMRAGAEERESVSARSELDLLLRYGRLPPDLRLKLLADLSAELGSRHRMRQLIDDADLTRLDSVEMAVGAHGSSHLPLTRIDDARSDLKRARERLTLGLGRPPETLSFPHGCYDAEVVTSARKLGYRLLFTSDAVINACYKKRLSTDLIGRILISARAISSCNGDLVESRLANWLFRRPHRVLAA